MSEPINPENNPTPVPGAESTPEKTFTQADVDSAVGKAIARIKKGIPNEEELSAFRTWKESQKTEQERWDSLTQDRDANKAALTAAEEKIQSYEREKYLLLKGVPAADVDYYSFKIGKMVNDETTFEKAAEQFLKDNASSGAVRVNFSAPLGGGTPAKTENETMNNIIRGFRK